MDDGDEKSDDEKLQLEHGDVGGVPTRWLVPSEGIHARFYTSPANTRSPVSDLPHFRSNIPIDYFLFTPFPK